MNRVEVSNDQMTQSRSRPVRLVQADRRQLCWAMLDVERLVEEDHPVRAIWELVGQLNLSAFAAGIGSLEGVAGRPAYDPRLLVSLWIYSYSRGIGSAREVERRCEHDPGFRWLMGLLVINHHTLSDFRLAHREALDEMFTQVLAVLSTEGLIALQTVMHDGTKITAQAGPGSFGQEEQIVKHLAAARDHVTSMGDPRDGEATVRQAAARERAGRERIERLEQALLHAQQISAAKPAGYAQTRNRRTGASSTDPEARIMRHGDGHYALSYNVQISTDAAHGIAVGLDIGQTAPDYEYLAPAIEQIGKRLGQSPDQMVVDAGYTSRENILAAHEKDVELVGPWTGSDGRVKQRFARVGVTDAFLPDKFQYDTASDSYICPEGRHLTARYGHAARPGRKMVRYQASQTDCRPCLSRRQCCSGNQRYGRSIVVTHEDPVVSAFRARKNSPETKVLIRERGRVAEFVNAWLKDKLGLRRFRVRGLAKAGTEALWALLAYNIRQWIRLRWRPRIAASINLRTQGIM
ncbi:IS1182 family transposase [Phyllobacterium sp. SB3]|uniref:IS1182 family transposase n=1 Tax=Phyllobacterium sp. SB3 TaxID=3156073 RepID=UPI0032AEC40B